MRFNPAPGWPQPPSGWFPPTGWTPPAHWPPAPAGWPVFLVGDPAPQAAAPVTRAAPVQPPAPVMPAAPARRAAPIAPATPLAPAADTWRGYVAPTLSQPEALGGHYERPSETAPVRTPAPSRSTPTKAPTRSGSSSGDGRAEGLLMIGAAVVVFIICAVVQGACGSSMFSSSYSSSTGAIQSLLVNLTFYPGWLLTGVLALGGIAKTLTGE
jgi:hypothetical protein